MAPIGAANEPAQQTVKIPTVLVSISVFVRDLCYQATGDKKSENILSISTLLETLYYTYLVSII